MFQFTREFIINDNLGKLTDKRAGVKGVRFCLDEKGETLFVDNMINIRKKDVHAVYTHKHEDEVKEKAVVKADVIVEADPTATPAVEGTVKAGDVVRLVITLGKRGQTTATFNDNYPDHSRILFYETSVKEGEADAEHVFEGLLSSYAHEATLRGEKFAELSLSGDKDLVIEALDCYTIVKEIRLVKLPVADPVSKIGALLTGYEEWDAIVDWKRKEDTVAGVVELTKGSEGCGNTVQILKNMRLLTDANLNPYGLNMDERPLPKGKYDQYTVELVTERRHIGHDVMGSVGTSLTTIVFYVLTGATCEPNVSEDFGEALAELWDQAPVVHPAESKEDKEAEESRLAAHRILAHTSDLPEAEPEESSASSAE